MSEVLTPEYERRFGGLQRLYGTGVSARLSGAHVVVAGIGGVGAWCAEALARSGVGAITLIDMDHVAESNVNRQLHAVSSTLGQSKVVAMAQRIHGINASCRVTTIDDFVTPDNAGELLASTPDILIDCTDQVPAKVSMVLQARQRGIKVVVCGGAGGKTDPLTLRAGDLSHATYDALLGRMRNTLRRQHGFPKVTPTPGKRRRRVPKMGVWALWFEQEVILPPQWDEQTEPGDALQGLSCSGYGSVVTVTATMGMAAANQAITLLATATALGTNPSAAP